MASETATAETEWLSNDEQEAWRRFVTGARRLLDHLEADLKRTGVSHDDYGVLVSLSESQQDRLRMSELADEVVQSRSRLSHHIGRLEKKGLVERQACPEDGRGSWAVLTPAGRELMERVAPSHVTAVRRYLVDVVTPEELAVIGRAFAKVDAALTAGPCAELEG